MASVKDVPPILTIGQCCDLLRISRPTFQRKVKAGLIQVHNVAGSLRVLRDELLGGVERRSRAAGADDERLRQALAEWRE